MLKIALAVCQKSSTEELMITAITTNYLCNGDTGYLGRKIQIESIAFPDTAKHILQTVNQSSIKNDVFIFSAK